MLAEVHVYVGGSLQRKYEIQPGEYLIGRDASCHILVEADQVSRHHARLTFNSFELLIEDMGSSNGLFLDGVQIQIPTRIRPEQEVQIGSARIYIRLQAAAQQQFHAALWDKDLGLESVRQMLTDTKYKIVTTIARGGMGVVMQARDLRIRRTVAMKVMKTSSQFSRENVLRFIDEAQLTGQLEHPNIVPVYELALDDQGEVFYTMRYVRGTTLDEVLRGIRHGKEKILRRFPLATLLTVFQKVCDGVAYAHSKGVIHRDLKPENIMIGSYGEVMVMDWGLAKNLTGAARPEAPSPTANPDEQLQKEAEEQIPDARGFQTMHGLVVGTPPYISPEQARGELDKIDHRSDIFVLGGILYAVLTLRAPVDGGTVNEVIDNILADKITPPITHSSPAKSTRKLDAKPNPHAIFLDHLPGGRVPESLNAIVMKAMTLDPEKRYQSVEEMQTDLTAYQGGFATKAERAGLGKQILLWAARHKREVTLFSVFGVLLLFAIGTFVLSLKRERDAAIRNLELEKRVNASEKVAEQALEDLRQTAPTFASDAQASIEDLRFDEALEKIAYAIEQQPENADFWQLKGNVLQSMLRFKDAQTAYETALRHNPKQPGAAQNLELCRKLTANLGPDGKPSAAQLKELQQAMLQQNRVDEAFAMLRQVASDRELFRRTILDVFGRLGLQERVETNDNETINLNLAGLDLSKGFPGQRGPKRGGIGSLRELRNRPIASLNLDGARVADLTVIKGWKLEWLSINNNPVSDLAPLIGMPLKSLHADSCPIRDLRPLSRLPLETLHLRNTRIQSLQALRGIPLEHLSISGCREINDLAPLENMPLQQLDLSRTSISDLAPLGKSPIRELNLEGCTDLIDLRPLAAMKSLEAVILPKQCKDVALLRDHPTLKRISYKKLTQPAYEFWDELARSQPPEKAPDTPR
jgi:serine/threonine protein kinase